MGRIKSKIVKRTAKTLLNIEDNMFTEKYEDNKRLLADSMPSKKVRNQIAGYITRLKKSKQFSNSRFEQASKFSNSREFEPAAIK
ncbi:MAG: 30S ribosomal protein S17e [Candidatus Nanoarchaeia archaeon]|nr:30S ribosomal protein S17e [Candidatus Nanoarchaeia archaeon]